MKILALCDSPVCRSGQAPTGFGRVGRNLFAEWTKAGVEVDIWALHFDGWGYQDVPWKLFPGGSRDWNSPAQLSAFLTCLMTGGYTHCWILSDPDALCVGAGESSFPNQLRNICRTRGIRTMLYFPVDAYMETAWMAIIEAVDVAVSYTVFGREEVRRALGKSRYPIAVLPHGLDPQFQPGTPEQCVEARRQITVGDKPKPFARTTDFLILNVNKNEWRKDPLRTLEITRELLRLGVPAKVVMRMDPLSAMGGVHLHRAAEQLGLVDGVDYVQLGAVPELHLPSLYHAADVYLTTTLGEGWGLGITEALGCGTPVAMPRHTSCEEIGENIEKSREQKAESGNETDGESGKQKAESRNENEPPASTLWLQMEGSCTMGNDTRLRRRVSCAAAAAQLKEWFEAGPTRVELPAAIRDWLSWERVAKEMLEMMKKP